jgi:hypothetical protein
MNVLKGAWVRPDGGYVIQIKGVGADGALDAMYFNPAPLPFAQARASVDGALLRVSLELRAGGYGGSTYELAYDPGTDRLKGCTTRRGETALQSPRTNERRGLLSRGVNLLSATQGMLRPRWHLHWLCVVACLFAASAVTATSRAAAEGVRSVLVIYANNRLTPGAVAFDRGLRDAMARSVHGPVQVFSEFLDIPYFNGPALESNVAPDSKRN